MKNCICRSNTNSTGISLEHFEKEFKINFQPIKKIKELILLKCSDCGTTWLYDNTTTNRFCHRIYSETQNGLLKEWEKSDTDASHLLKFAEEIGSSSEDYIEYPCKATLINGEILDLCVLSKWSHHPLISWPSIRVRKFIYSSQVKFIEPSEFALTYSIRTAMRNCQMDYYRDYVPLVFVHNIDTFFRDEGCKTYYFDSNFIRYNEIKGKDIIDVNQDIKTYSNYKEKEDLKDEVTLILFDKW
jgi:hypothetical protein